MNQSNNVGRFDDAALMALFVDNAAPTMGEISLAKAEMLHLLAYAADVLDKHPVVADLYARQQPGFRLISQRMEQHGWTYCGSGYYSACYYKGGLTIKIGFKPEDTALPYLAWCRANQGKPGVPVIHKLKSEGLAFAVLMDRLNAVAGELTPDEPTFDPILHAEFDAAQDVMRLKEDGWVAHMPICRTAMAIREFFEDIADIDLCSHNVMIDREGNLVITDPVSFVGDYQSNAGPSQSSQGYLKLAA